MGLKLKPNYVAANDDFNQWKSDMVGNWKLHVGGGGGEGEFAVYTGYEYSEEDVTIDKQIDSITVKASLSFKYGPISGGKDVTGVTAREQTRQTTERTARSEKTETRWTCPPKEGYLFNLYQWELSGQFAVPELLNSPIRLTNTQTQSPMIVFFSASNASLSSAKKQLVKGAVTE